MWEVLDHIVVVLSYGMDNDDELVSRTRAAEVLKRNARTINAALKGVAPDETTPGRPQRWRIATIKAALDRRDTLNADFVRNGAAASQTASLAAARARLTEHKAAVADLQRRRLQGELAGFRSRGVLGGTS